MPITRKAQCSDAAELARIAELTFRDTFGAVNSPDDMNIHCSSNYGKSIQIAEIADPRMLTLISEQEGHIAGFAQLRWKGAPSCVLAQFPIEIQRLYVTTDWQGKGVAQDLMRACLDEARHRGGDAVWLGVWERNPRAIAFYEKTGFIAVGDHVFPLGRDPQRDIVMRRLLPVETA